MNNATASQCPDRPDGGGAPGLLPVLCAPLLLASALFAPQAFGQTSAPTGKPRSTPLDAVRAITEPVKWPSRSGFSAALPNHSIQAPPGNHEHTQAYQDSNGCVAFFYPLGTAGITDVSLRWNGSPCNGAPVQGVGELSILRKEDGVPVVGVFQGHFRNGMLSGKGAKGNFAFNGQDQEPFEYYLFNGEFANNLLNGPGMMRYVGAPTARPRAYAIRSDFRNGLPFLSADLFRLQPYEGVEAEVYFALSVHKGGFDGRQFNANNLSKMEPSVGVMYFENDSAPWKVTLESWRNGAIEKGTISGSGYNMSCKAWRSDKGTLHCRDGVAYIRGKPASVRAEPEFLIRKRGSAQEHPLATENATLIADVDVPMAPYRSGRFPMQCDAGLENCEGQGPLPITGTSAYWMGPVTLRNDVLMRSSRGVSVLMDRRPSAPMPAPKTKDDDWEADDIDPFDHGAGEAPDKVLAKCSAFTARTATTCQQGEVFFHDGSRFVGAWRLEHVEFSTAENVLPRSYALKKGQEFAEVLPQGEGWFTFPSKRSAKLRFNAQGEAQAVLACQDAQPGRTLQCRLEGRDIVFSATANEASPPAERLPLALLIGLNDKRRYALR